VAAFVSVQGLEAFEERCGMSLDNSRKRPFLNVMISSAVVVVRHASRINDRATDLLDT
jgi:hypothetical protein